MNQLERLQRLRKGENVPAPLTLQVPHDAPTIFVQKTLKDKCAPEIVAKVAGAQARMSNNVVLPL